MSTSNDAMSGDARLAYTVRGRGPHQIVFVPAWLSNQDVAPTPAYGEFWEHVSTFATVVMYDPRGSGLSDPVALDDLPTLERWADDPPGSSTQLIRPSCR